MLGIHLRQGRTHVASPLRCSDRGKDWLHYGFRNLRTPYLGEPFTGFGTSVAIQVAFLRSCNSALVSNAVIDFPSGKSVLARYFAGLSTGLLLSMEHGRDCLYIVKEFVDRHGEGPRVVVFNVPRSTDPKDLCFSMVEEVRAFLVLLHFPVTNTRFSHFRSKMDSSTQRNTLPRLSATIGVTSSSLLTGRLQWTVFLKIVGRFMKRTT